MRRGVACDGVKRRVASLGGASRAAVFHCPASRAPRGLPSRFLGRHIAPAVANGDLGPNEPVRLARAVEGGDVAGLWGPPYWAAEGHEAPSAVPEPRSVEFTVPPAARRARALTEVQKTHGVGAGGVSLFVVGLVSGLVGRMFCLPVVGERTVFEVIGCLLVGAVVLIKFLTVVLHAPFR